MNKLCFELKKNMWKGSEGYPVLSRRCWCSDLRRTCFHHPCFHKKLPQHPGSIFREIVVLMENFIFCLTQRNFVTSFAKKETSADFIPW